MGDLPGSPSVAPSAPFLHASGAREKRGAGPLGCGGTLPLAGGRRQIQARERPFESSMVERSAQRARFSDAKRAPSARPTQRPGWARNLRLFFLFSGSPPCSTTVSPSPPSIPFARIGFQTWPGLVSARWKDNRSSETNAAPSVAAELTPFFPFSLFLFGSAPYSAPVSSTLDAIPCPNRSLSLAEPRLYEAWHRRTMSV